VISVRPALATVNLEEYRTGISINGPAAVEAFRKKPFYKIKAELTVFRFRAHSLVGVVTTSATSF